MTTERTDIYTGDGKHSRHYSSDDMTRGIRKKRSAKHRYVYFCTYLKNEKKQWKNALKYEIQPYPKGDNNEDYQLGDYLKEQIVYQQ